MARSPLGAGGFLFFAGHLLYELQKTPSQLGVAYPLVGANKLQSAEIGVAENTGVSDRGVRLIPEGLRRDAPHRGEFQQPVQWYRVLPDFVFMNLLVRDAKAHREIAARQPPLQARRPYSPAYFLSK
jgi:hypothetical protein